MNQYYGIINTIDPNDQTWITADKMTAYQQINQPIYQKGVEKSCNILTISTN